MMILTGILSLIGFCLGVLLVMVGFRGLKLYINGDLKYLGRGYKNKEAAENGIFSHQDRRLKVGNGFIMDKEGNLLSNACPSDAEIYLRLKGEGNIAINK